VTFVCAPWLGIEVGLLKLSFMLDSLIRSTLSGSASGRVAPSVVTPLVHAYTPSMTLLASTSAGIFADPS